jgi:predicted membrane chloride channel (bestrophin family)
MTYKELLREGWETVKDVARPTVHVVKLSWRETFKLFRRSVLPAIWERIVGIVIFGLLIGIIAGIVKVWYLLMSLAR